MRRTFFLLKLALVLVLTWGSRCAVSQREISCGINIDPYNQAAGAPAAEDIVALNATYVRFEYIDTGTDPSNPSNFGFYDTYVKEYTAAGLSVLIIFDYTSMPGVPSYPSSEDPSAWTNYLPQYVARVSAVAQHYAGMVTAYEIWNEPDDPSPSVSYSPTVPISVYATMLAGAYASVKSADANAKVIVGGLESGNPQWLAQVMSANNNTLSADAVGVHPYGQRPTPDWPNPTWGFGVLTDLMAAYYQVANIPLWITEIGTDDTTVQDDFPYHAFAAINSVMPTQVPVNIWFCWSDGMVAPFGVVDVYGNPKGSYYSFGSFAGIPH